MKSEKNITEQLSTVNHMLTTPSPSGSTYFKHVLARQAGVIGMGGLFERRGLTNSAKMMVSFFLKS